MFSKYFTAIVLMSFVLVLSVFAQVKTPEPKPTPTPPVVIDDNEVVKISTNLIQIDVTVTDKKGKQVTNLKPEDFEVYENKDKQEITNFSYISSVPTATPTGSPTPKPNKNDPIPIPPAKLKLENVRRTIALVADDLGLSFESVAYTRSALKKFVDEQMQEGDLVAIIRTSSGIGSLQQFTSDKRQLYAAIEKVRYNANGRSGISAFAPIDSSNIPPPDPNTDPNAATTPDTTDDVDARKELDNFRNDVFTVGTLGAVNYIVNGMKQLPGRKAVMLFSDGFKLYSVEDNASYDRTIDALKKLVDRANRASVVIYTFDARGLVYTGITAADDVSGLTQEQQINVSSNRSSELFETQEGLNALAIETGGIAFRNNNDLSGGIKKILEDQSGYYLIGYQPDADTFDPKTRQFNKLLVKVRNPDLKVRFRSGFFGVKDEEVAPAIEAKQTPAQQIDQALTSPFAKNDINLHLAAIFYQQQEKNEKNPTAFVRSILHVDVNDITFTDQPDGKKKATSDIVILTFDADGNVVNSISKGQILNLPPETYKTYLQQGINYILNFEVPKEGAYQLRAVFRDSTSGKIGSAMQFIEVPNVKKNRLRLSDIVLDNITYEQYDSQRVPSTSANTNAEGSNTFSNMTLRNFKNGSVLTYGTWIYNARLNTEQKPQLQTQVRLFRGKDMVYSNKPSPIDLTNLTDTKRIGFSGALNLGKTLPAGEYILQVIITDTLAKGKNSLIAKTIDFEVTK